MSVATIKGRIKRMKTTAPSNNLSGADKYYAAKAMQEITDRLYTLQQYAGLTEDWVQQTSTEIQHEFEKATGIDLGEF